MQVVDRNEYVPIKTDFKPTMTLLSRRPPPVVSEIVKKTEGMSLEEDLDSEEEEERRKLAMTAEERKLQAQREREEKQRKYQEVRDRLFGTSNGSGESSPSTSEPQGRRGKGNRGGSGRSSGRDSPASAARSPRNAPQKVGNEISDPPVLFDADYAPKPNSIYLQKLNPSNAASSSNTSSNIQKPIREPRGPDGSGRGGFGFNGRGRGS